MNIGVFTNNYLPNPYGVAGSIESFRKQFEKAGHRVFIFAPRWKGYKDENPNACPPSATPLGVGRRVFRYPSLDIKIKFRFPLAIPYSRELDRIISQLDLDIIHSQHPNLLGTAARKWARKKNIPLVFTCHTLYDQYAHFAKFIPKKIAANYIIKKAVKYANACDQVIVPTESVKEIIQKWGVVNENIEAIPTGVEEKFYQNADRNLMRKKYNIKDGEVLLLLVSRLTAEKNVEFLLHSLTPSLSRGEGGLKVKLLVVGGGYLLEKLKKFAVENNISDKVIFTGEAGREETKNYYAAGDIFVYASKSETQGMIVSEAMYCGLPIVAVNATGICDLVENNINGFLVPENDQDFINAVERLAVDKELRSRFGKESAKIARGKYTDKICAEKMLELYRKTINLKLQTKNAKLQFRI